MNYLHTYVVYQEMFLPSINSEGQDMKLTKHYTANRQDTYFSLEAFK